MTRTSKVALLIAAPVLSWLAGLALLLAGAASNALPGLVVPLVLAGGLWAAMTPLQSRLPRLYPMVVVAGLCVAGGPGLPIAVLVWGWFWAEAGTWGASKGWSLLLGLMMAVLFFSSFWTAVVWPGGGWGVTVSIYGSPVSAISRAFLAHGANYDPRVSNVLYNLWYGTRFPVVLPAWWQFAGVYLIGGAVLLGLHLTAADLLGPDGTESKADARSGTSETR